MPNETTEFLCKALVIGSIAFTGYEIARFCMSQEELTRSCRLGSQTYLNAADNLTISLEHLLAEQIA